MTYDLKCNKINKEKYRYFDLHLKQNRKQKYVKLAINQCRRKIYLDKNKIKELLTKEIKEEQILLEEPMKKHTSFKIGGIADIFVKVKTIEELKHVIKIAQKENIDLTIIGNGSNVLVKDNGIRGIVAKLDLIDISINHDTVIVGAGVKLGELAQRLLKEQIAGFEFAAGIPGTIGGAVRMNAGAYGGEMKDIVIETKCLDLEDYERKTETITIDDIEITQKNEVADSPKIIKSRIFHIDTVFLWKENILY